MQIDKLVEALSTHRGPFPHAAVAEAVARQEEITPALLDMLAHVDDLADREYPPEEYMGHIMACYLLAQFRETRAYRPIVKLFSPTRKIIDDIFDDFITETLPAVLASVFDGDLAPLMGMIRDLATDVYVRAAGLHALSALVAQGDMPREDLVAILKDLFQGGLEQEPSFVWGALVNTACDIHPQELMDEIEHAFEVGLADPDYLDLKWVNRCLAAGQEAQLAKLAQDNHNQYIADTAHDFSSWAWFQPRYWPEAIRPKREPHEQPVAQVMAPSAVKPGRNDPCPCGSGRKYKHCCMRKA